jgi:hypothetical protein
MKYTGADTTAIESYRYGTQGNDWYILPSQDTALYENVTWTDAQIDTLEDLDKFLPSASDKDHRDQCPRCEEDYVMEGDYVCERCRFG